MNRASRASGVLLLGLLAACAVQADEASSTEDDLSTTDTATVGMVQGSQRVVWANLASTAPKAVSDSLVAAAKRGVDVHVILTAGSHDPTWLLQQHLESNGVDVDVRATALAGVSVVADDKALVSAKVVPAGNLASKFLASMMGADPKPGALLASGVRVWPMPESSRDRVVQIFDAARASIDLEVYQLQERRVVRSLEDAARRGVKVRVMLEPKTVGAQNYQAMTNELTGAGITVRATPVAFDSSHNVDHAKFAVIDGKELVFGTGNLVRSGLGGVTSTEYDNRDFWVEDARATNVSEARSLFEADWAQQPTKSVDLSQLVVTPDNANARITGLVDGAKKRLTVYNQSLKDDDLVQRLIDAKKRGVVVRVLLGYQPPFGGNPPDNQGALDRLTAAGIEAGYLKLHYLHAKAIVADDQVFLGSQNFTNGGMLNNRELGEILSDATAVALVQQTFESDH